MDITSAEFVVSNSRADMCPQTHLPEYAFIGRSNVGKSSLINMLTKNPKLAMTSATPGKTLLINHFLFVLIDSRLEPQRIDLEFIEWLGENGIPFALIFTKADKQSVGKTKASVNRFLDTLKKQWEELPPHFISSSENKTGRQEILDYIEQVNRSLKEQAE